MQALIASDDTASDTVKYLGMASAGAVSIITIGIKTIIKTTTEYEGLDSRTQIASSLNSRPLAVLIVFAC